MGEIKGQKRVESALQMLRAFEMSQRPYTRAL